MGTSERKDATTPVTSATAPTPHAIQSAVPNRLLGRVMGLLLLAMGIAQGSGLLFGVIGQAIGLELLFPVAGIGVIALALGVFAAQPPLRRLD